MGALENSTASIAYFVMGFASNDVHATAFVEASSSRGRL